MSVKSAMQLARQQLNDEWSAKYPEGMFWACLTHSRPHYPVNPDLPLVTELCFGNMAKRNTGSSTNNRWGHWFVCKAWRNKNLKVTKHKTFSTLEEMLTHVIKIGYQHEIDNILNAQVNKLRF